MKILSYRCKFCHAPGEAGYEEFDGTTALFNLESWASFLVCNRCADFYEAKRKIEDRVAHDAKRLQDARNGAVTGQKLPEAESTILERITQQTKDYAYLVARHLRCGNAWEDDFPQMIMDKPTMCRIIMSNFFRNIKRHPDKFQPAPSTPKPHEQNQMPLR